ncbi:MAG: HIT family protein [Candidatus Nomurabacteria bacterium]|nr:MAG: HIT family protein [Candidatus Nomurabacteria bacterium]
MDDIFLKIINREIPAYIVYEDDKVIAFLDINPVNRGHALVVPKTKFRNILDGDSEVLAHMMKVAQKIAQAQMKELKADGVTIVMNNEPAGGQEVWHAHLHVVPRFDNDEAYQKPRHVACTDEEFVEVKEKLSEALA